jgi:hypothetical protein
MNTHGPKLFVALLCVLGLAFITSIPQPIWAFGRPFGGKIQSTKATSIETLEDAGYECEVDESSFQIKPAGNSPSSYVKPGEVSSKTKVPIRQNLWVLGLYTPQSSTVTCILEYYPYTVQTLTLNRISMFGTSRQ